MITGSDKTQFRRRLLNWFDRQQRDLPWRRRKSLFRIWISEIMLQQTQVVTVIDYFDRFVKRFPNVRSLAEADESEVLKLWEGLGYYRRARQMHAAARQIVAEHGGRFPTTQNDVLALPGIGRYTANAILSIADNQRLPILEGNTIRVYSRLFNYQDDVTSATGQKVLWDIGESLVSRSRPGDLNQALMELGSECCTVKSPRCTRCPVHQHCLALQQGDPESLPNKGSRKTKYEDLHQVAIVIRRVDRVAIRLCGPDEHWTGLWDFPRFTMSACEGAIGKSKAAKQQMEIQKRVAAETGLSIRVSEPFQRIKHAVTRYRITLDCFLAENVKGRLRTSGKNEMRWIDIDELSEMPMSATGRKIAKLIIGN